MSRFIAFCLLFTGLLFHPDVSSGSVPVGLPANTALFRVSAEGTAPENAQIFPNCPAVRLAGAIAAPLTVESSGIISARYDKHPLTFPLTAWQVTMPDGQQFLADPRLTADPVSGKLSFTPDPLRQLCGIVLLLAGLLCAGFYFRAPARPSAFYTALLTPTLLHIGWLLWLTGTSGLISHPIDEIHYYEVARDLLAGSTDGPWLYTLGWPLCMAFGMLVTGVRSYVDSETLFSCVNGFILMPFVLMLAFLILKRISGSAKKALLSVLLWQTLSVFLQFRDFWAPSGIADSIFINFFALPGCSAEYHLYMQYTLLGFNALSDTPSMLLVFLCILVALRSGLSRGKLFVLSALFALACLVRINNLFYAPLLLWLTWLEAGKAALSPRQILLRALPAAALFLLLFSVQLLCNHHQFGGWFRFPYVLHGTGVAQGFLPRCFPDGVRFLFTVHFFYFTAASAALLTIRNRVLRTTLLLWILPVLLFFCGYIQVSNNANRFLLPIFVACSAAIVLSPVWNDPDRRFRLTCAAVVFLPALFTTPTNYAFTRIRAWHIERLSAGFDIGFWLNLLVPLALLIPLYLLARSGRRPAALLLAMYPVIYASGCPWLPLILFLLAVLTLFQRTVPRTATSGPSDNAILRSSASE